MGVSATEAITTDVIATMSKADAWLVAGMAHSPEISVRAGFLVANGCWFVWTPGVVVIGIKL